LRDSLREDAAEVDLSAAAPEDLLVSRADRHLSEGIDPHLDARRRDLRALEELLHHSAHAGELLEVRRMRLAGDRELEPPEAVAQCRARRTRRITEHRIAFARE